MTGRLGFGKHQQGQSIHIWRKDQKFPAKHYLIIQYLLLTKDCIAATTLFSFNDEGLPPAFKRMFIDLFAESLRTRKGKQLVLRAQVNQLAA
jgi:hypothetical protein